MEDEFKIKTTIPPEHVALLKPMKTLTEIANEHTCDKGTEWYEKHGYTEIYDKYIPERGKVILLEIGVWHGDSVRMWKDYNPELIIDAIDIDEDVLRYIQPDIRSNIFIGNATDKEFLNLILNDAQYDFVIDDGSHTMTDILLSLKILWKRVKSGGIYFIEDLHAPHARRAELMTELIKWFGVNPVSNLKDVRIFCDGKLLMFEKQ